MPQDGTVIHSIVHELTKHIHGGLHGAGLLLAGKMQPRGRGLGCQQKFVISAAAAYGYHNFVRLGLGDFVYPATMYMLG